jgi:Zn-dependent metalloprotease
MKLRHIPALLAPLLFSQTSHAQTEAQLKAQTLTEATQALKQTLVSKGLNHLNEQASFTIKRRWTDELGKTHTHFKQTINGIPVYGTDVITHADAPANGVLRFNDAANIYAVSGQPAIAADVDARQSRQSLRSTSFDLKHVLANAALIGDIASKPALAYVYLPQSSDTKLAWKVDVKYDSANGFEHDIVFFDASNGVELVRHPQVNYYKNIKVYDMKNHTENSSYAPGDFACSNWSGDYCKDESAQRALDGASAVYDYFKDVHKRIGANNSDLKVVASVHTGSQLNNASWDRVNNRMFFGDGDGIMFRDLTYSFDVIAHEFTHGVIQYTAGLTGYGESGALNEAMADIFAVSAKAWQRRSASPNWQIGVDTYTPGTANDALRYMDNPTKDGESRDWYPDRYIGNEDRGGIHRNSGIVNLAYQLLVNGGFHPRAKSDGYVPFILLDNAQKVFYRALSTYFTQSTNFEQARSATLLATRDLFPGETHMHWAIEMAWCTVGVGTCPGSMDQINVRTNSAPYPNAWLQCKGSFASWTPFDKADQYIVYYSNDLNEPDDQWREVYRGTGIYRAYSDSSYVHILLLNAGYFGVQACGIYGCGKLYKSKTPLIASFQYCSGRI